MNYEPDRFDGPMNDSRLKEPPLRISGDADRYNHRDGNENCSLAGALYRLMNPEQKSQLIGNLIGVLKTVPRQIQLRQIGHFCNADPNYGGRVAEGLGVGIDEIIGRVAWTRGSV